MSQPSQEGRAPAEVVTTKNFGDLLIEGLNEAVEIHEGRRQPATLHSYPVDDGPRSGQ